MEPYTENKEEEATAPSAGDEMGELPVLPEPEPEPEPQSSPSPVVKSEDVGVELNEGQRDNNEIKEEEEADRVAIVIEDDDENEDESEDATLKNETESKKDKKKEKNKKKKEKSKAKKSNRPAAAQSLLTFCGAEKPRKKHKAQKLQKMLDEESDLEMPRPNNEPGDDSLRHNARPGGSLIPGLYQGYHDTKQELKEKIRKDADVERKKEEEKEEAKAKAKKRGVGKPRAKTAKTATKATKAMKATSTRAPKQPAEEDVVSVDHDLAESDSDTKQEESVGSGLEQEKATSGRKRKNGGSGSKPSRPNKRARTSDPEESADEEMPPTKPRCQFLELPLEIREIIYKELLQSSVPITVRKGWTEFWTRKNKDMERLHVAIIQTNSQIAHECVRVLYGSNTFEYFIREPVEDLEEDLEVQVRAVHREEKTPQDIAEHSEMPSGSEYEASADEKDKYENHHRARRVVAKRKKQSLSAPRVRNPVKKNIAPYDAFNPEVQINQVKFGHHFRHIKIKIEKNRAGAAYAVIMAAALAIFRNLRPLRARLHTITFEITPIRLRKHRSASGLVPDSRLSPNLTFVKFFEEESGVVRMLKVLSCQFIRIIVNTHKGPREIVVDRRHAASLRRAKRGEWDIWAGDVVMQEQRRKRAGEAQWALKQLPRQIETVFKEAEDKDKSKSDVADSWSWGDFHDDDFSDGFTGDEDDD